MFYPDKNVDSNRIVKSSTPLTSTFPFVAEPCQSVNCRYCQQKALMHPSILAQVLRFESKRVSFCAFSYIRLISKRVLTFNLQESCQSVRCSQILVHDKFLCLDLFHQCEESILLDTLFQITLGSHIANIGEALQTCQHRSSRYQFITPVSK